MLTKNRTTLMTMMLALAAAASAYAQTPYNRSVGAISVLPATGALSSVVPYIRLEAAETTAPLDLSTRVMLFHNGSMVASYDLTSSVDPAGGCGITCATFQPCICTTIPSGQTFCFCSGGFVACPDTELNLQPGDEIMVLLRPAPGALPEEDQDDDQLVMPYHGEPIGWNRKIVSVDVTPTPGASGRYDIAAEVGAEVIYEGHLPLGGELELLINGVAVETIPAGLGDYDWAVCSGGCGGSVCASDPGSGATVGLCGDIFLGCGCELAITAGGSFEAVPLDPDDEIVVILRPVPGALPELPGFPDDDEEGGVLPCQGDVDGNGFVGFTDLIAVLAAWGPCAGCPEDLNGDDIVGFVDLLTVLSAWGPCIDV